MLLPTARGWSAKPSLERWYNVGFKLTGFKPTGFKLTMEGNEPSDYE
jgi:hypothetical protein